MLELLSRPDKFSMEEWQAEDIEFLLKSKHGGNWSDMGTYKTSTALWLIERLVPNNGNVLIVTTKSGKGAYFDSIPRTLDEHEWQVLNIGTRKVEEIILGDIRLDFDIDDMIRRLMARDRKLLILAHYNCFLRSSLMYEILVTGSVAGKILWDVTLLDEAHKIRNKDNQWTRGLKKIAHAKAQTEIHRHAMTGTGFGNNPAEFWSIAHFLYPEKEPSYWRFRRRFCEEDDFSGGYSKIVGIKEDMIDEFITLRKSLGPRRKMAEVHKDIAEPIYDHREVELNPVQRRMYKEIVRELRMLDQQGYAIDSPNVVSQLQRLRQISVATPELVETYWDAKKDRRVQVVRLVEPSSKLDEVMEIIEDLHWDVESRQQVVIFSSFKDPLELLKKRFDAKGISYIHMEEKDSDTVRFQKWHELWPKKNHQVFLSTIDLGGESINLASAQYCIFLDRSWSPIKNNQAIGRVYRPGQTGVAEFIYINAKNSADKKVLDNVTQKTQWFNILFNDEELE